MGTGKRAQTFQSSSAFYLPPTATAANPSEALQQLVLTLHEKQMASLAQIAEYASLTEAEVTEDHVADAVSLKLCRTTESHSQAVRKVRAKCV